MDELRLSGELPRWLRGSLLRTGPAKFEVGEQRMRHWFDGLAMLHRFTIERRARLLRQPVPGEPLLQVRARAGADGLWRVRDRSLPFAVQARADAVLAGERPAGQRERQRGPLGERFIAMTETPLPVQFDPHTLQAAGVRPYAVPGQLTTAHPHLDRASGGDAQLRRQAGPRSSYRFFEVGPRATKPRVIASLPV